MIDGPSIDRHHWIPRAQGGKEQAPMHRVCHKKIHSVLTEREIAVLYSTPDALRAHPEIARFIDWVQRHPPEWNDRHRSPRRTR
jgi:hypothetical protein